METAPQSILDVLLMPLLFVFFGGFVWFSAMAGFRKIYYAHYAAFLLPLALIGVFFVWNRLAIRADREQGRA